MIFGTLRRGQRVRHLLTAHLILGVILPQSGGLLCTLEWPSVAIVGTGDIQHIPVVLKVLNVRNVVVLIELRITDCWLGVARASQGSPSRPSVSRTFKMTTQGPTRRQVLIPLAPAAAEMVVANAVSAVEPCNKGLVSVCFKLRVKSVHKA